MKKITLLLIALLTTGTVLMAQGGPRDGQRNMNPKDRAERMTERMAKEYSLNETQKKQLYDVNLAMAEEMALPQKADSGKEAEKDAKVKGEACSANCDSCKVAAKNKKGKQVKRGKSGKADNRPSGGNREQMMGEMKKSREDYNTKIEKIFTKEQYETYTKKQAERQGRMGERGPRPQ